MKTLDEVRSTLVGPNQTDYKIGVEVGWDSAIAEMKKRNQVLVDALQFACGNRCAQGINPCNAREALDQYNKGEMK